MTKRIPFLSNKRDLLPELIKSKNSYAEFTDPRYRDAHATIDCETRDIREALNREPQDIGRIVRVLTWDHIPLDPTRPKTRHKNQTHVLLDFIPFQVWTLTQTGWQLVGRSHYRDGEFCARPKGAGISSGLARMIMMMVERYGAKGNWRGYSYNDDMQSLALVTLCEGILKFNETKSDNVLAYATTAMSRAFIRTWTLEKKAQSIRDDMLESIGAMPSMTRQLSAL